MKKIILTTLLSMLSISANGEELGIGKKNLSDVSRVVEVFFHGTEIPISNKTRSQYEVKVLQAPSNSHDNHLLETWFAVSGEGFYSDIFNLGNLGQCFNGEYLDKDLVLIWCGDEDNPKDIAITLKRRENIISIKVKK